MKINPMKINPTQDRLLRDLVLALAAKMAETDPGIAEKLELYHEELRYQERLNRASFNGWIRTFEGADDDTNHARIGG